jgi:hypothetical protein
VEDTLEERQVQAEHDGQAEKSLHPNHDFLHQKADGFQFF